MNSNQVSESTNQPRKKNLLRQNLLINQSCQLLLLKYSVLTVLLTSIFFLGLTMNVQGGSISGLPWPALLIGFGLFSLLFLANFWISNQIVGPIYRLEKHMEAILKGESVSELRFRKNDQFQTTAEIYNKLLKHFAQLGEKK